MGSSLGLGLAQQIVAEAIRQADDMKLRISLRWPMRQAACVPSRPG